ncbi:hypothetical protein MMC32_003838 [Xylographa parallela]|nr:hypothetical protein [Xylographa parallela]
MIFTNTLVTVLLVLSASSIQANPVGGVPSIPSKRPGNQIKAGNQILAGLPSLGNVLAIGTTGNTTTGNTTPGNTTTGNTTPGNTTTGNTTNTNSAFDEAKKKGKTLYETLQKARSSPSDKDNTKNVYDTAYTELFPNGKNPVEAPLDLRSILKEQNLPTNTYYDVEVQNKPKQPRIPGLRIFGSYFDPTNGVIIADNNDRNNDVLPKPQQLFWSDAVFQGLSKLALQNKVPVVVKYVFQHFITNANTINVIAEVLKHTKEPGKPSTWTLKDNADDFYALIGCDNGKGLPRLLGDYSKTLKSPNILQIILIPGKTSSLLYKVGADSQSSTPNPPSSTPTRTVKPINPPSAPSCFPSPTAHVQDAHEGYEHDAANAFCKHYATNIRRDKVDTEKEEKPWLHQGDDATDDNASALPPREIFYHANGAQYEFKIKSLDGCPAPDGYNLDEPIKGYKCETILVNAWKTCYGNAGRGGVVTAGCLTYSAHPKH